jgi:hypothetical protein
MSWSGIAIDPDQRDGLLQVEFYHYLNPYGPKVDHLAQRPNLILRKESSFFIGFWKSLDAMWRAARSIDLQP